MENPAALLHAGDFERLNAGIQAAAKMLKKDHGMSHRLDSDVQEVIWNVLFTFHRTVRDYKKQDADSSSEMV